ncbi:unnamed protein product [Calicophoron daubneyi]|uniref:Acetyltransferase component of pyruvate dehydrogenase complex n=1 Tax=Calicophoron daubneyi TaxID=300641 RepID=A0AAV2SVU6_CALDB
MAFRHLQRVLPLRRGDFFYKPLPYVAQQIGFLSCCSSHLSSYYPRTPVTSAGVLLRRLGVPHFFQPLAHFSSLPSHHVVTLPNLSPTMETGGVVSWAKKEGDEVNEGDLLAEIETDKATMSFEASDTGFLAKILIPAGKKDIPVGTPLCVLVENAGDVAAFKDYQPEGTPSAPKPAEAKPPAPPPPAPAKTEAPPSPPPTSKPAATPTPATSFGVPQPAVGPGGRIFVSPYARRLAAERGINLADIKAGTGLRGMIVAADLQGVMPSVSGPSVTVGGFTDQAIAEQRTAEAARYIQAKQTIPHYYLTMDVEVDGILKMRDTINKTLSKRKPSVEGEKPSEVTLNDILVKAAAVACLNVPECNSSWQGEVIRQFNSVGVSLTLSTPGGIVSPVILNAESKGIVQINKEVTQFINLARENKLGPQQLQGGTFGLSNLGMFGIASYCAIINPPQACALAIGKLQTQLVPDENNKCGYKTATVITVTLSCDHRVIDGAVGSSWLAEFKSLVENPAMMLS